MYVGGAYENMKKRHVILVIAMSLFMTSCGSVSTQGNPAISIDSKPSEVVVTDGSINMSEAPVEEMMQTSQPSENGHDVQTQTITQSGPYGSITVTLPKGWSYRNLEVENENLRFGDYGIQFYPKGVKEGCVELAYSKNFGICGTGLTQEKITLCGEPATLDFYDGSDIWEFATYDGNSKHMIASTISVDSWWDKYSEEVMKILDTMTFNPDEQSGAIGILDEGSDLYDICLTLSATKITPTKATLNINQYDKSVPGELTFGEEFEIERKQGGKWVKIPDISNGEYGFHEILNCIEKDDVTSHEFAWEGLYGALKPGDYRIKIKIYYVNDDVVSKTYPIYAYFLIR